MRLTRQRKKAQQFKQKPIVKYPRKKKRLLKYIPKKGEQMRQWAIEKIIGSRMRYRLRNKTDDQFPDRKKITMNGKEYVQLKEYHIVWEKAENGQQWPNTWQPQQFLLPQSIHHYLVLQKQKQKQRKFISQKKQKKQITEKAKSLVANNKKTYEQDKSLVYTTQRTAKKNQKSLKQRQEIIKTTISKEEKKQIRKKEYKEKKAIWKYWFKNYTNDLDEYKEIIRRFLAKEKNENIQQKLQLSSSNIKSSNQHSSSIKKQRSQQITQQRIQNFLSSFQQQQKRNKTQNKIFNESQQSYSQSKSQQFIPQTIAQQFVRNITYSSRDKQNSIDYFRVELINYDVVYITQQDLIRYFPFKYEKLLNERFNGVLDHIGNDIERLQKQKSSYNQNRYNQLNNVSISLGFSQELTDIIDNEYDMQGFVIKIKQFFSNQVRRLSSQKQNGFGHISSFEQKHRINSIVQNVDRICLEYGQNSKGMQMEREKFLEYREEILRLMEQYYRIVKEMDCSLMNFNNLLNKNQQNGLFCQEKSYRDNLFKDFLSCQEIFASINTKNYSYENNSKLGVKEKQKKQDVLQNSKQDTNKSKKLTQKKLFSKDETVLVKEEKKADVKRIKGKEGNKESSLAQDSNKKKQNNMFSYLNNNLRASIVAKYSEKIQPKTKENKSEIQTNSNQIVAQTSNQDQQIQSILSSIRKSSDFQKDVYDSENESN